MKQQAQPQSEQRRVLGLVSVVVVGDAELEMVEKRCTPPVTPTST